MPKRVIDFDAMWGSDKIAACAEWAQAEYAWLYGLADPSGCFELTNLRVIWGRVAAIRRNLTIERLEQVFGEFQEKGLLFVWEQDGKRYGHWTGSDVPGRLPPPSWRMRLERLAPPVPKQLLAEYVARFARGRAASPGGGFLAEAVREEEHSKPEITNLKARGKAEAKGAGSEHFRGQEDGLEGRDGRGDLKFEISDLKRDEWGRGSVTAAGGACSGIKGTAQIDNLAEMRRGEGDGDRGWSALKGGVEETHAEDLDLGLSLNQDWNGNRGGGAAGERAADAVDGFANLFSDSHSEGRSNANANATIAATLTAAPIANSNAVASPNAKSLLDSNSRSQANSPPRETEKFHEGDVRNTSASTLLNGHADSESPNEFRAGAGCSTSSESAAKVNSVAATSAEESARTRPVGVSRGLRDDSAESMRRNRANGAEWKSWRKPEWGAARNVAACAPSGGALRGKAELLERELRVGQGPSSLGPVRVKPEALERIRQRDARQNGTRSP